MASIITAVLCDNRLYLGYGPENTFGKVLGRTISLAWGAGTSPISINGQPYNVNTGSFNKHLVSLKLDDQLVEEVEKIGYERLIEKHKADISLGQEIMVNNLPHAFRDDLHKQFIEAICTNNTQQAKLLARSGAYLDKECYGMNVNDFKEFSFDHTEFVEALQFKYNSFTYGIYTPLALAYKKGNLELVNYFYALKQDITADKVTWISWEYSCNSNGKWYWKKTKTETHEISIAVDSAGKKTISWV